MTIDVRPAENDEATYRALVELLVKHMYPEVALVEIDQNKTLNGIYDCLAAGVVFNAYDGDRLVGSLGATVGEWWFSAVPCLFDRWYYVLPDFRGGEAGKLLERTLRDEAQKRKMPAYISVSNANRRKGRIGYIIQVHGGD